MPTIQLSPIELTGETREMALGNVPIMISLSAYDIPRSITVERDEQSGRLHIQFGYLDQEAPVNNVVDQTLMVQVGKNSGKVLGFILRPTAEKPKDITIRIVESVDRELARVQRDNQRLNYELIKRVVRTKMEPMLTAM